jgi:acetolactate synthase-1/2/3 large subunit
VKTVIINNRWQGMVRQWQQAFHGERYSSSNMEAGMPDFVKLAEAYGVKGVLINSRDELKDAIAQILAHEGPVLVDVRVTRDENCYPMVAPGKSNAQMIGLPERSKIEATELIYCSSCGAKNVASNNFCPECGTKI